MAGAGGRGHVEWFRFLKLEVSQQGQGAGKAFKCQLARLLTCYPPPPPGQPKKLQTYNPTCHDKDTHLQHECRCTTRPHCCHCCHLMWLQHILKLSLKAAILPASGKQQQQQPQHTTQTLATLKPAHLPTTDTPKYLPPPSTHKKPGAPMPPPPPLPTCNAPAPPPTKHPCYLKAPAPPLPTCNAPAPRPNIPAISERQHPPSPHMQCTSSALLKASRVECRSVHLARILSPIHTQTCANNRP